MLKRMVKGPYSPRDPMVQSLRLAAKAATRNNRRSPGIIKMVVNVKPQVLCCYQVYFSNLHTDRVIHFPGEHLLTHVKGNVYEVTFIAPVDNLELKVTVRLSSGWITITGPGEGWLISCQVGKPTPKESNDGEPSNSE